MDMAIDATGRHKQMFTSDDLCARAHDQLRINTLHGIGIARLANFDDAPIFNADVALDDAPMINDKSIGDDQIEGTVGLFTRGTAALAHTVANDFATAEGDFIAIDGEVLFHFNDQFGICQAHPISRSWAVEVGIGATWNIQAHNVPPRKISTPLLERSINLTIMPIDGS